MGLFDFLRGSDDPESAGGGGRAGLPPDAAAGEDPPTPEAEALATEAAEHVLDFSPESLRRLDRYVETLSADERDRKRRAIGAYLGETFVREYGAEWRRFDDAGWVVRVANAAGEGMLLPLPQILADCLDGDATFALVHDSVVADAGLGGPEVAEAPRGGPPESPLPEEAVGVLADRAEALAADFPDHDLDFSPASLARLDDLVAEHYDQSPPDVDRDALAAESPPGGVPEGANLVIGSGGAAGKVAAYAGEVYRRTYGAEWHEGDGRDLLVVDGDRGSVELEPDMLVSASFAGHVSFARLHDALAEKVGLEA